MQSNESKLMNIKEDIIKEIAYHMKLYGVSETVGRVMATIYYHERPMTLDELSEEMGMSKMSMSNAVRELMTMGIAEKVFMEDSRKHHYTIEQDYYQFFIDLFCTNWGQAIHRKEITRQKVSEELNDIIHNENESEEAIQEAKKLLYENKRAIEYFNWIRRLINHFDSNEIFKHVPKTHKLEE